jgi:CDP-diacylglycerol---serine O-phosphatidyltransferase
MNEMRVPLRRVQDAPRRKLRKGLFLLPSLFTAGNIAAGYYAIVQAMQGSLTEFWHFDHAAIAIGFAILFDGLDGRIARMTNTTSDFGREFDSLADVITFGVAPAVLAWMWGFRYLPSLVHVQLPHWLSSDTEDPARKIAQLGLVASFIFLTAGASRLARFNIAKNPQPSNPGKPGKKYFVGMPIPGGAGVIAAVVHFNGGDPVTTWWTSLIWGALIVATGFLMVSTWRFASFKGIDLHSPHTFRTIILIAFIIAMVKVFSGPTLLFLALTYMLSGVLARLFFALRRGSPQSAATTEVQEPQSSGLA